MFRTSPNFCPDPQVSRLNICGIYINRDDHQSPKPSYEDNLDLSKMPSTIAGSNARSANCCELGQFHQLLVISPNKGVLPRVSLCVAIVWLQDSPSATPPSLCVKVPQMGAARWEKFVLLLVVLAVVGAFD